MYPTVADVLVLPAVRRGRPVVVAGRAGLDHRVRWVHVAEIADIAHLLRGNELVLTTGIALPEDAAGLTRYVAELARVGASGLVIELLRRWPGGLPEPLVSAAEQAGLPLIALPRETRFVAVTEAVAALIVNAQLAELRAAEQVHETFTALTVACAEPAQVLREVARTAGLPVVLETLGHDVLAYDSAGTDATELLADWADRSASVALPERTGYHEDAGWLVTSVGARGAEWGRLVLVSPTPPAHRQVVVAERAASALAVHRLVTRDRESLERHSHRTLLTELLAAPAGPADLVARAAALGVPLRGRRLVGVAVRPRTTASRDPAPALATQELLRDLAEATALAARRLSLPALVGVVDDTSVRALLALPATGEVDPVLRRLAEQVRYGGSGGSGRSVPVVVGVGSTVDAVTDARRSLVEADHVAGAAARARTGRRADRPGQPSQSGQSGQSDPPFHRLADVRLPGLLHLLRDDDRLAAFVQRELGPLLARDARQGTRLVELLRGYCEHGGNKTSAAEAAHLSRTAYYQQLARIEGVLGVSLNDPESVLSLYVALLALDITTT
ncbi:PucR family transcriptional regulator [Goodfellowiella coeruleoviolacea]|uniref:Purine catabolism regulatory protein n=1 Tax=Goodfellowiella coeruleoviolacea TaxID=334858 RepID=A0AAE3GEF3_9PSEU|nr:PucR family transcriptional regulator [Goodfellowiella coeruleoviolacea]MCP2166757.1 purine catabolism regulatory protein [Goodfellowiella coeruleoviolacea]